MRGGRGAAAQGRGCAAGSWRRGARRRARRRALGTAVRARGCGGARVALVLILSGPNRGNGGPSPAFVATLWHSDCLVRFFNKKS